MSKILFYLHRRRQELDEEREESEEVSWKEGLASFGMTVAVVITGFIAKFVYNKVFRRESAFRVLNTTDPDEHSPTCYRPPAGMEEIEMSERLEKMELGLSNPRYTLSPKTQPQPGTSRGDGYGASDVAARLEPSEAAAAAAAGEQQDSDDLLHCMELLRTAVKDRVLHDVSRQYQTQQALDHVYQRICPHPLSIANTQDERYHNEIFQVLHQLARGERLNDDAHAKVKHFLDLWKTSPTVSTPRPSSKRRLDMDIDKTRLDVVNETVRGKGKGQGKSSCRFMPKNSQHSDEQDSFVLDQEAHSPDPFQRSKLQIVDQSPAVLSVTTPKQHILPTNVPTPPSISTLPLLQKPTSVKSRSPLTKIKENVIIRRMVTRSRCKETPAQRLQREKEEETQAKERTKKRGRKTKQKNAESEFDVVNLDDK